jgi:CheY-like chemotaxis protein
VDNIVRNLPLVLYVEDDQISREIVSMYLKEDFIVETAKDSCEAFNKIKAKEFALILMDINLCKALGGLELAKAIKNLPGYNNIPIIAVTAYSFQEDVRKILNGGCTHYISKPFNRKSLIDALYQALDSTAAIFE